MNTKTLMTVSAVVLGTAGLVFSFAPDIILTHLGILSNKKERSSQITLRIVFSRAVSNDQLTKGNLSLCPSSIQLMF